MGQLHVGYGCVSVHLEGLTLVSPSEILETSPGRRSPDEEPCQATPDIM